MWGGERRRIESWVDEGRDGEGGEGEEESGRGQPWGKGEARRRFVPLCARCVCWWCQAVQFYQHCLALAEGIEDEAKQGEVLEALGQTNYQLGDNERALYWMELACKLYDSNEHKVGAHHHDTQPHHTRMPECSHAHPPVQPFDLSPLPDLPSSPFLPAYPPCIHPLALPPNHTSPPPFPPTQEGKINAHYFFGKLLAECGSWTKAVEHMEVARDLVEAGSKTYARVVGDIGFSLVQLGEREKGLGMLMEMLQLAAELGDATRLISPLDLTSP